MSTYASRLVRALAVWWSGKSLETLRIEWHVWYFLTQSRMRAYCHAVSRVR